MFCRQCGGPLQAADQFCSRCGATTALVVQAGSSSIQQASYTPPQVHTATVARGFSQLFGLDPRIAFLTFIVDLMLNAGDIMSMGLLVPVSIAAGIVLGYIAYKAQMNWYGDDTESAKIKAVILALLTAIPTPLPAFLYFPSGVLGLFHLLRRKRSR